MPIRVLYKFIRLRFKTRMEYRASFIISIFSQLSAYAANYILIWLLLQEFGTINGWTWSEIALLYSINLFSYAIAASFTWSQTWLDKMINRGTFDGFLLKPLQPFFHYAANNFNLNYIAHITISGFILLWSLSNVEIEWNLINIIFLVLSIISASLLQASAFMIIGSWAFYATRSQFLFSLFFRLREFNSYPISLYEPFIQAILTFIIPLAFINYYPSSVLLLIDDGIFPNWIGWLSPLIGILTFYLAFRIWMFGVRNYQSAGG